MKFEKLWYAIKYYEAAALYECSTPFTNMEVLKHMIKRCRKYLHTSIKYEFRREDDWFLRRLDMTKKRPYHKEDVVPTLRLLGDVIYELTVGDYHVDASVFHVDMLETTTEWLVKKQKDVKFFLYTPSDFKSPESLTLGTDSGICQAFISNVKGLPGYADTVSFTDETLQEALQEDEDALRKLLCLPNTAFIRSGKCFVAFTDLRYTRNLFDKILDEYTVVRGED